MPNLSLSDLSLCKDAFNINATTKFILDGHYDRIALQFPDDLLKYSSMISSKLSETGKEIYVLADTTFNSCCVDEIAAQHVNAQLIVHYGHACMSFTRNIDVYYVFPQAELKFTHFLDAIRDLDSKPVLIFWDPKYHYLIQDLKEFMNCDPIGDRILWSQLDTIFQKENDQVDKDSSIGKIGLRSFDLGSSELSDVHCIYIGQESLSSLNIQLSTLESKGFSIYDPESLSLCMNSASKLISKRYYLVQKAKDSERIGIVVGTFLGNYFRDDDDNYWFRKSRPRIFIQRWISMFLNLFRN
jgi:diphthamide biosynthesis protein 2